MLNIHIKGEFHYMKKRRMLGIIISICLLFSGCGVDNENTDTSPQELQQEEAVTESSLEDSESAKDAEQTAEEAGNRNETEQAAEDAEKEESAEETAWAGRSYMKAYRQFLESYVEENEYAQWARVTLALIDDDNVPELLLIEDNSHAAGVKVYTYSQKSVIEIGEFGATGSMQYVERGGMILSGFTGMGECDSDFYQLEDGEEKLVCSLMSYEQPDGLYELYEIDGVSVTEEAHDKKWEELYDADKYVAIGYDDAFAIGETEISDLLDEALNALLLQKGSPRLAEMVAEQSEVLEGYEAFLAEYVPQRETSNIKEVSAFSLIYLDGDDVPELVVMEGSAHAGGGYVYIFEGGEVIPVGEYGQYGTLHYREKEGIIFDDHDAFGDIHSAAYQIEESKETLLQSWSEMYEYTVEKEELHCTYMVDGKEVSEEQYQEVCDKWNKIEDKTIQYDDCRTLTGGDIQNALTEELENLILTQEEVLKQNVLIAAGAHESDILLLDYDDYDKDGKYEVFMICGDSFEEFGAVQYDGVLYFAGADICTLVQDNPYTYAMIDGKMKFGSRNYLFFYTAYSITSYNSEIWTVRDGKPVEGEFSHSGQVIYRGENWKNEFEIWVDSYDHEHDVYDDYSLWRGHTYKPYFFHYNYKNDRIEAYGGEIISGEAFEELSGTNLIEEIEAEGYIVGDIIHWGNDIVTINYEFTANEYGTIRYENVIWDNNIKDFWQKDARGVTSWKNAGKGGSFWL